MTRREENRRRPIGRVLLRGGSAAGGPLTSSNSISSTATLRPPARRVFPSSDLAAYRAQLDAVGLQLSEYGITNPFIRPDVSARLLFELLAAA